MGFKGRWLEFLAGESIDLHALARLIECGCAPLTAVKILAGKDFQGKDDDSFDFARMDELLAPSLVELVANPNIPDTLPEEESLHRALLGA